MLYQLSYASPFHLEITWGRGIRTGTLPLRAYHGTDSKVSTPEPAEQTARVRGKASFTLRPEQMQTSLRPVISPDQRSQELDVADETGRVDSYARIGRCYHVG